MNKKISTLLAAFLAAGYSYTVEAGIVKVASVTNGKTYVIANTDGSKVLGHEAADLAAEAYVSGKATQTWKYVDSPSLQLQDPADATQGINVASSTTLTYGLVSTFSGGAVTSSSIKIDATNFLTMAAPGTAVSPDPSNVQFAVVATPLANAENVPVVIGDQYLVIENGAVKTVDKAGYLKNSTVWTIKDGKISNGGKFVKLAATASLVEEAEASIFEKDADNKLTVVSTGFNKYVNKSSLALEDNATNADVFSTTSPYSYTEANIGNIATGALAGFPSASRFVVYTGITSNGDIENISTKDGAIVVGTANNYPSSDFEAYYWSYDANTGKITNQSGDVFSVGKYQEFLLVQGMSGNNKVNTFWLMTKDGQYVTYTSSNPGSFATGSTNAAVFSVLEAKTTPVTVEGLNKQVGNGFDLSIYTKKDGTKDVEGADIFAGVLTAEGINGSTSDNVYYLKNAEGKYLALNNDKTVDGAVWGSGNNMNGTNNTGFKFTTVDKKDAEKVYTKFKIETADNGASLLVVRVMSDNSTEFGRLFITKFNGKYYLTTKKTLEAGEAWPYIVYGSNNRVDIKTLLKGQFVNVAFANKQAKTVWDYIDEKYVVDTNQKYKLGGVLAIARRTMTADAKAEYVPSNNVLSTSPETQWAIQYVADGNNSKATFVNRENPAIKVSNVVLYQTGVENVYAVTSVDADLNVTAKDTIRLSFVNHTMFDGFKYVDPAGLNDTVYNVAAYKAVNNVNNAYWVEKNHSTTHQIGLDGDAEKAGNWNLRLATKTMDKKEVIDTVFVISEMSVLKDGKVADKMKKDTLAILPYAVQNAGNREFVRYDGTKGVEYYICDKDNKTYKNAAGRFALKEQPNGTYHLVTIDQLDEATGVTGKPAYTMGVKLFAGNAAKGGTLDNIANYTTTFNDLMVVQPVSAPEYRKVVKEWGDTIRIYRNDNSSQVLYEKLDPKSVVKGESFLNIDNINQFDVNPAIFVDTAYINRGTNTCWQYLLAVNVNKKLNTYCPDDAEHNDPEWIKEHGVCPHALKTNIVKGRFLINLMDTANVYEATHQHDNPYVNEIEAYEFKSKLGFVEGMHVNDTLFITREGGEVVKLEMDSPNFNIAKFAFRYVDREAGSFKIQTQVKKWKDGDLTVEDYDAPAANQGYLRWVNGTVVVTETFENGDVFNMEEGFAGDPTANDAISASKVTVVAGNGSVTIKGAAGKTVSIANVLGQTIANTVLSSDEATIAAPAGVVVVAVEGEAAVKAIVK